MNDAPSRPPTRVLAIDVSESFAERCARVAEDLGAEVCVTTMALASDEAMRLRPRVLVVANESLGHPAVDLPALATRCGATLLGLDVKGLDRGELELVLGAALASRQG